MTDQTREQKTRKFNARWYQDETTGLATIRRHPEAATEASRLTADQVRELLMTVDLKRFE